MSDEQVKTKFKGPGEWRSQAAELENDAPEETDDTDDE